MLDNKINNRSVVNTDFRTWVLFEELMADMNISEEDKLLLSFELAGTTNYTDIIWFYSCGKTNKNKSESGNGCSEVLYSFTEDEDLIYAAFKAQYNIDLMRVNMHWWEFKALFVGLHNQKINDIMGYRGYNGTDKEYLKLKSTFALPFRYKREDTSEFEKIFG